MKRSEKIQLISDLIAGKLSKIEAINQLPKILVIDWDDDPEDGSEWLNIFLVNGVNVSRAEYERVIEFRRKLNEN